jgi:hypothetical protein
LVGIFVLAGFGLWWAKERDNYSRTERRVLYTALILAVAIATVGLGIISLIEP